MAGGQDCGALLGGLVHLTSEELEMVRNAANRMARALSSVNE